MVYPEAQGVKKIIDLAKNIVVIQADNPDGDSLASALALEQIFSDIGKTVYLYCGIDVPSYLRYLPGWDRVNKDLPKQFDAVFIVDTSADSLLSSLDKSGQKSWIKTRDVVVLDHHKTDATIDYAKIVCNHRAVATGEIIYELCQQLKFEMSLETKNMIATSILSDSLGLMSEGTTARSIRIISELVESGVKLAELDSARREMMRKSAEILSYKGRLLQRVEYASDGRLAIITIPWEEIERYSHEYNPSMLVIDDMRLVDGVDVAIAYKIYNTGAVTAKIRCNYGKSIADKLAEHFGGGGHPYASGFRIAGNRKFEEIKTECSTVAGELLDKLGD